jgi:hypothetical protein
MNTAVLNGAVLDAYAPALAPGLYPSLLAAFHARIDATPALAGMLAGGHFTGDIRGDALPMPPWARVAELVETSRDDTAGKVGEDTMLQVSVFDEDADRLKVVKAAFEAAFTFGMAPLSIRRRPFLVLYQVGPELLFQEAPPPQSGSGLPLFHQVLQFRAMLGVT